MMKASRYAYNLECLNGIGRLRWLTFLFIPIILPHSIFLFLLDMLNITGWTLISTRNNENYFIIIFSMIFFLNDDLI